MANTVYIIYNTAGSPVAAIQPNTLNGPGGVQQSSDLSMFGLGYALWGQAADQNDYRNLENFACPESTVTPGTPANEDELGKGNGVNMPLVGQLWFNTTDQSMYVKTSTSWEPVATETSVGPSPPVSPAQGQLWYDTSVPQLMVWSGSAWDSVASRYLPLSGGTLTGSINMGGNNITNVNNVATSTVQAAAYRAGNGNTSNQITIPNSGNANTIDGPRIGPNLIIHQGNSTLVSGFIPGMIMMWYQNVAPVGWAICDGTNGTPDLRNRFIVGATSSAPPPGNYLPGTFSYGVAYGGATLSLSINGVGDHNHTGNVGGTALTTAQIPSHIHPLRVCINGSGDTHNFQNASGIAGDTDTQAYWTKNSNNTGSDLMQGAGLGQTHAHTVATDGAHTHTGTYSLPPTVGLFFIMKL